MHILVTGAAGFIGSHLSNAILNEGHKLRIVDNFATGKRQNLANLSRAEFIEGDISDAETAAAIVQGIEVVFHEAAIPSVARSLAEPMATHKANVNGTINLLLAARDAGVRRFIYAGSSSAYGDTPTLPKREDMAPSPLSPYALQKSTGTQYCQMFTQLYGFETVVTRYFNVFGPRQDPGSPYSGVISLFSTALIAGRQPVIYGDGEQTRDFTYVANVVDGVLRACTAPKAAGEAINLACGIRISLNELLRAMNRVVGTDLQAIYKEERAGDVKDSQADITKAETLLAYTPIVSFEEGLRQTLDWCRSEGMKSEV